MNKEKSDAIKKLIEKVQKHKKKSARLGLVSILIWVIILIIGFATGVTIGFIIIGLFIINFIEAWGSDVAGNLLQDRLEITDAETILEGMNLEE
jgi:hypothetical protein